MNAAPIDRATRIGRRLGILLGALLLGGFTVVCSVQILEQGLSTRLVSTEVTCRSGLLSLVSSLNRARATSHADGSGERVRMQRFRSALLPEWQARHSIEKACADDPYAQRALSEIDRLRWAEEHAVRYESVELASSRQRVLGLEQTLRQRAESVP